MRSSAESPVDKANRWLRTGLGLIGGGESVASRLANATLGTAGLQVGSMGIAFGTSVLLARVMGTAWYGAYTYSVALLYLMGLPALLGLDKLLVRGISGYSARSEHGLSAGLLRRADQIALAASFAVVAVAVVANLLLGHRGSVMTRAFWWILPAVPLITLTRVRQSALQGLHRVVRGWLSETVVQPAIFLLLVVVLAFALRMELRPALATGLFTAAYGVTLVVSAFLLRRHLPGAIRTATPEFRTREWLGSALPLVLVSALFVVNSRTDTVMLGAIKGAEPVGLYNVASRGAQFVTFFLVATNRAIGPSIAELHAHGARERLQRLVTRATVVVFLVTLPFALALIFFGDRIIGIVYGQAYVPAHTALGILTAGQLVNVSMGCVGMLLLMTGHEKDAAAGVGTSAVLNVVLNALLIPRWSLTGAAVATAISLVVWNLIFAWRVHVRLEIFALPLPAWLRKREGGHG